MRSKIEKAGLRFEVLVPCLVGGVHPLRVSLRPDGSLLSLSSYCTEHRPSEATVEVCRALQGDAMRFTHTCAHFVGELREAAKGNTTRYRLNLPSKSAYPDTVSREVYDISMGTFRAMVEAIVSTGDSARLARRKNPPTTGLTMDMERNFNGLLAVARNATVMEAWLEGDRQAAPPATHGSIVSGNDVNTGFFRPRIQLNEETGKREMVMVASYVSKYRSDDKEAEPFGAERVVAVRKGNFRWEVDHAQLRQYAYRSCTSAIHYSYSTHCATCNADFKDRDSHAKKSRHIKQVERRLHMALSATDDYLNRNLFRKIKYQQG